MISSKVERALAAAEAEVDAATVAHQQALAALVRSGDSRRPGSSPRSTPALDAARERLADAIADFHAARRLAALGRPDADGDLVVVEHKRPTWGAQRAPTLHYPQSAGGHPPEAGRPVADAQIGGRAACPACGQAPAGPRGGRCPTCIKARRSAGRGPGRAETPCRECGQELTPRGGRCPTCAAAARRLSNKSSMRRYRYRAKAGAA
jgi:hypothetical protein